MGKQWVVFTRWRERVLGTGGTIFGYCLKKGQKCKEKSSVLPSSRDRLKQTKRNRWKENRSHLCVLYIFNSSIYFYFLIFNYLEISFSYVMKIHNNEQFFLAITLKLLQLLCWLLLDLLGFTYCQHFLSFLFLSFLFSLTQCLKEMMPWMCIVEETKKKAAAAVEEKDNASIVTENEKAWTGRYWL